MHPGPTDLFSDPFFPAVQGQLYVGCCLILEDSQQLLITGSSSVASMPKSFFFAT